MPTQMSVEDYLAARVQDQIDWHDARSRWNKAWFGRLQGAVIVLSALLPFLAGYQGQGRSPSLGLLIGAVGVAIAALSGWITLHRFQETWIEYRLTAERLTHEKYRFLTRAAPYDGDDAFGHLVERVEAILGEQNEGWRRQAEHGSLPMHDDRLGG